MKAEEAKNLYKKGLCQKTKERINNNKEMVKKITEVKDEIKQETFQEILPVMNVQKSRTDICKESTDNVFYSVI